MEIINNIIYMKFTGLGIMPTTTTAKIICITILVLVILFASFLQAKNEKSCENFESTTYTASLLNALGPIIYDSSTLSVDKIETLRQMNPPINDESITSYLNSNSDPDAIITSIKNYLGSCPTDSKKS
jgi:hypothetical protein